MLDPVLLRVAAERDKLVLVERPALDTIHAYRQTEPGSVEAGGILLGYRRADHLHIVEATEPGVEDHRHRTRFFRQRHRHQEIALRRWRESERTMDYLGEWHTHPELNPSPSHTDLKGWRAICYPQRAPMVFIIAAMIDRDWFGIGQDRTITRLELED